MYCGISFPRLLFCFFVLSLVGCDQNPQQKPREQAKENREEVAKKLEDTKNQVFAEFQKQYNADATWQGSFKRFPVRTMEVEDRLIPADGRPILSTGSLHDVTRKGDEYRLHFRKGKVQRLLENNKLGVVDMDFILNCNLPEDKRTEAKSLGDQLVARDIGKLRDEYAFVAKIQTVERIDRLIATATSEESAEIQVDNSPHFIATGKCLAVKYIGEIQNDSSKSSVLPRRPGETPEQYLNRINH